MESSSERDRCSSDRKSTEHHGNNVDSTGSLIISTPAMAESFGRGLWSSPMAEAAMNMAWTHPNASHLPSGSAFGPFSKIDIDVQGLTAKKRKRNCEELENEQTRGEAAAMAAESKESVDAAQRTEEEAAKEDYIHVRARRGQATNSHSLAERVRREKISQRMKFLQELVPGCSKVTGKAVMLDEIINYVQSLQRQVEFLSMKLAAVNPRTDYFGIEALLSKDQFLRWQSGASSSAIGFSPESRPVLHAKVDLSRRGPVRSDLSASSLGTATAQLNYSSVSPMLNAWEEQLQSSAMQMQMQMQMACFASNINPQQPRTDDQ